MKVPNPNRVKLLKSNIANAKSRLYSAADKDSVRRQISAMEKRLAAELKEGN